VREHVVRGVAVLAGFLDDPAGAEGGEDGVEAGEETHVCI